MNDIIYILIAFIASCICGFITIPIVLDFCKSKGLYDLPGGRKVHKNAVPRLGGVVFLPCVLIGCIVVFFLAQWEGAKSMTLSLWTVYFIAGISLIYFTGLVDDIVGLSAKTKLCIQLVGACALPISGLWLNNLYGFLGVHDIPYYIGAPLTVLIVTFISNAINLIDGIDGLASGLSLIILLGFTNAFMRWGLLYYTIIIAALIGVLVAYMYYNLFGSSEKNRKIFMGDTGSLSLGFLLAFLSLKISMNNPNLAPYPGNGLLTAFTLLIVPVADVFRVSFVRLLHHHSPFRPDKNHIHHKLLRAGLSQHKALITILCLAVAFCAINYTLYFFTNITVIILLDVVIYILFHQLLNMKIKKTGQQPIVFQG